MLNAGAACEVKPDIRTSLRAQPDCGSTMGAPSPLYDASIHAFALGQVATRAGLSVEELTEAAGIAVPTPEQFATSIPYTALVTMLSLVLAGQDDRNVGLRMAEGPPPPLVGLIGYYLVNQPLLRDILAISYDILGRLSNVFRVELKTGRDPVRFSLHPTDPEAPLLDQMAEFHLAIFMHNTRKFVSPDFQPRYVAFAHPAPEDSSEHERIFRCPISFGARTTRMEFDAAWLDAPVPDADPGLQRSLRPYVERELEKFPQRDALSERVGAVLRLRMGAVPLTLKDVARHMGFAPRTLQQQLQQEGTTFQAVLDANRRNIALEALRTTNDPMELISGRLGFADTSAFYRAFRRWTGQAPQVYRNGNAP